MNIIYLGRFNTSENLIGPEKVAKRIFNKYTKSHKSVFIEYFFDGRKYNYYEKLFGNQIITYVNRSPVYRLGIFNLLYFLFLLKPKIIHIITFERFAVFAYLFKLFKRVSIIYNVHGIMCYEDIYLRKDTSKILKIKNKIVEKIFLRFSEVILILSENSMKLIEKYYKIERKKFIIIPNGIDKEFYDIANKRKYKAKSNLKIAFVSNINRKEKGYLFLKESLEEMDYPIELHIIGKKKENKINSFRNKKIKVYFYDKMITKKYAEFLICKDVYISSSFYDLFPISLMEAIATGIIPIITIETGSSNFIINEVNGYKIDYGDRKKLITVIYDIINNPNYVKIVSSEAKKIYNLLSWEKIFELYSEVYLDILEK